MLYETPASAVFIDPLADERDEEFWAWADARCAGREVVVAVTIGYHERSRTRFVSRYEATSSLPEQVVACAFPALEETMYWLPGDRALVPGDQLLGDGDGGLRLCPHSWLDHLEAVPTAAQVHEILGVLRDLDAELVLVSHGEPVLAAGGAALRRALAPA